MNEQELSSLLRKVCEDPMDDQIRLVVSDAYEELGQPERAELIRKQIWWVNNFWKYKDKNTVRQAISLDSTITSLLSDNGKAWYEQDTRVSGGTILTPKDYKSAYNRGFLSNITCDWAVFKGCHADLFSRNPIEHVFLEGRQPGLIDLDYVWGTRTSCRLPEKALIAEAIFDTMKTLEDVDYDSKSRWCRFSNSGLARTALSRACVNWGRKNVGFGGLYHSACFLPKRRPV